MSSTAGGLLHGRVSPTSHSYLPRSLDSHPEGSRQPGAMPVHGDAGTPSPSGNYLAWFGVPGTKSHWELAVPDRGLAASTPQGSAPLPQRGLLTEAVGGWCRLGGQLAQVSGRAGPGRGCILGRGRVTGLGGRRTGGQIILEWKHRTKGQGGVRAVWGEGVTLCARPLVLTAQAGGRCEGARALGCHGHTWAECAPDGERWAWQHPGREGPALTPEAGGVLAGLELDALGCRSPPQLGARRVPSSRPSGRPGTARSSACPDRHVQVCMPTHPPRPQPPVTAQGACCKAQPPQPPLKVFPELEPQPLAAAMATWGAGRPGNRQGSSRRGQGLEGGENVGRGSMQLARQGSTSGTA